MDNRNIDPWFGRGFDLGFFLGTMAMGAVIYFTIKYGSPCLGQLCAVRLPF